jgi:N-acetylmuramic acid 6-phosphate etherase
MRTTGIARLLLGVDGGGSKTIALLAQENGQVIGRGQAGSSNCNIVGHQAAQVALCHAIDAAFADAGQPTRPVTVACLGLAGTDRPEGRTWVKVWVSDKHIANRILAVNDAQLVLAAGTPSGWGIAVVSGTGSIIFGRTADGRTARAGGWGHMIGDEGSGYAIGVAALRAIVQAADGRGLPTLLTEAVLRQWSVNSVFDLVNRVYQQDVPQAELAGLARLVLDAAAQGDDVSVEIARQAGNELGRGVLAVARALQWEGAIPCALAGGVLTHFQLVVTALMNASRSLGLLLEPVCYVKEPAQGAIRLAKAIMVDLGDPIIRFSANGT